MPLALLTLAIRVERDVVAARQRARQVSALLGFDPQDQARIATAVSEIARNAVRYAGGGEIEFRVEGERPPQLLAIGVRDRGPGIRNLAEVLDGDYRSITGAGLGITGARRLMDYCNVQSGPGGTSVLMKKVLPESQPAIDAAAVGRLTQALAVRDAPTAFDEVQQQNRELIRTLSELRERQDELLALNRELEDTNRGVVALYAELAERADSLRRADETKTRFFSNMSHEFRTPLNAILALSGVLLEKADGPLAAEQETQVRYIARAAEELAEIVNDLLDLAKIEAGKIVVRPAAFSVGEVFSALRGMLRPLLLSDKVALHFEAPPDLPALHTDENKVSQILRNLISNALKYTEAGEVRVSAAFDAHSDEIVFRVADTGIGIAEEDQELIFEEFEQVPNRLQTRVQGTGLGLPLSQRLAAVLGGRISVASRLGEGSVFTVAVRREYAPPAIEAPLEERQLEVEPSRVPVLVVEDSPEEQVRYEKMLRGTAYAPIQAHTLRQAMDAFGRAKPAAIVLDVKLGAEESWRWLAELKSSPQCPPVIVATAVDEPRKGYALGADLCLAKPLARATLLAALNRLTGAKILIIDDDPAARYTMRRLCDTGGFQVLEAADAQEGLRAATLMQPDLIVLDLKLPDRPGEEVLEQLVADEATRRIPVVIATAEPLSPDRRLKLGASAAAVFAKDELQHGMLREILASLSAAAPAP